MRTLLCMAAAFFPHPGAKEHAPERPNPCYDYPVSGIFRAGMKLGTSAAVALLAFVLPCLCTHASDPDYPKAKRTKMGKYEQHALKRADDLYRAKKYKQASAQYDAYIQEFRKSKAVTYCAFRKARCKHLGEGPDKGIKAYDEFLDYFPTVLEYAVPALHYIGEAYLQMHDSIKAAAIWAEMIDDEDYKKHHLSGYACRRLVDYLNKNRKYSEVMKRLHQCATYYRHINPDQARHCMNWYIAVYIRSSPNEPKLREFYKEVQSFEHNPRKIAKDVDLTKDKLYWQRIWERVWHESRHFNNLQVKEKKAYFKYWAETFAKYKDLHKDWKEFQDQATKLANAGGIAK